MIYAIFLCQGVLGSLGICFPSPQRCGPKVFVERFFGSKYNLGKQQDFRSRSRIEGDELVVVGGHAIRLC